MTQTTTTESHFERLAMPRLSHTRPLESVGALIERCARAMVEGKVCFGHGTDNARDEAAELVFHVAGIEHARGVRAYARKLPARTVSRIEALLERRIEERVPLAYLTRRAFFAGLEFYVDERVLVPRSPIAGLIMERFAPWIDARRVRRIVDVGTGSGAIALACAKAFARARVDALDISPEALAVCRRNVRRMRLSRRVQVLQSDYFAAVPGRRYDIIVSNPPYVGQAEMRRLPREYRHEPRLGLAAGKDGLDAVRAIVAAAPRHLEPDGILVVEVGNSEAALLEAFPRMPFVWPEISIGGGGVFILHAIDLVAASRRT
jgi:ribosomal protein L3 glutamine methyltransferase